MKRFFRGYLPDGHAIRRHHRMRVFGQRLQDPNLWHLNRRSLAGGLAVGLFLAFIPIPFQMILAAAVAIFLRVNLPIAVVAVWISNPLTMAPMLYFQYQLGSLFLGERIRTWVFEPTLAWFWREVGHIWLPVLLGGVACGLLAAVTGYGLIHLLWRINVRQRLRIRRRHRSRQP